MGCIYTAINLRASRYGEFKIGQTKNTYPTSRFTSNNLEGIYFIQCPKATHGQLLLLEAVARCACENIDKFCRSNGDDWFHYVIDKRFSSKQAQAEQFASIVMDEVIKECEKRNIEYVLKTCFKNGKRYSCAAAPKIIF